jgi:hypothetical protein
MGKEQEIAIEVRGQYKNLNPKKDLTPGNYILVEKLYGEGRRVEKTFSGQTKPSISYNIGVKYKGEEVSFFIKESEHEQFLSAGMVGDTLRITCVENTFTNKKTGVKMLYNGLEIVKNE